MSNLPPPEVLAARLAHELHTVQLLLRAAPESALEHVSNAQGLLAKLREAMR